MSKGTSESAAAEALRKAGLFVYKPPDDARNWKPCDFFVWRHPKAGTWVPWSLWVEVKSVPKGGALRAQDIRPSQMAGVSQALLLGIPYWLLVRWGEDAPYSWSVTDLAELQRRNEGWVLQLRFADDDVWDHRGTLAECVGRMAG